MSEIPNITERAPQRPSYVNNASEMTKGQALSEKGIQVIKEVAALLGTDRSVRVSNSSSASGVSETGTPTGATGIPALDNPNDTKALEADLEKLLFYLQLDNDEQQATLTKERIEMQKGELEKRHNDQIESIKKSLKEMDKAARMSLFMKIFGWLMVIAAVAFAVVSSVATGGVALGAVFGAIAAIGLAAANEAGAIDALTEKIADGLEKAGCSKMAAQIIATLLIAAASIALTAGAGAAGNAIQKSIQTAIDTGIKTVGKGMEVMKKLGEGIKEFAAKTGGQGTWSKVLSGMQVGLGVSGVGGTVAGGVATVQNYEAGMAQADVTELEKFLAMMRQQLDESQEELQAILEQIQNNLAGLIEILNSEFDTQNDIARNIGAMA